MSAEVLARLSRELDAESIRDRIRAAHSQLDKTRCVGWLRATGNRPTSDTGLVAEGRVVVSPQKVERRARPFPEEGCDMHPVEE